MAFIGKRERLFVFLRYHTPKKAGCQEFTKNQKFDICFRVLSLGEIEEAGIYAAFSPKSFIGEPVKKNRQCVVLL